MIDLDDFFDESEEQSRVKSRIVSKYFWAWAKVVIPSAKKRGNPIAYLDLFAGRGRYNDGTASTPLLVLERAVNDPEIRAILITVFNDRDKARAARLKEEIKSLPGVGQLKHKPSILNEIVGTKLAKDLHKVRLVPTLLFVDPWGYKGLSLTLIGSVLKDWGSDCIFFFNYNRINPGLNNPSVLEHMNGLFGAERVNLIQEKLAGLVPDERETLIISQVSEALQTLGQFVLPFRFKNEQGARTSHYVILVTKSFKGYEIMKDIMAGESSSQEQGVASFEYSPCAIPPTLFPLHTPLDDLEKSLLEDFAGQRLSCQKVYEAHSVGKPYVKSNYKTALTNLEAKSRILADPSANKRPKRQGKSTFGDNVLINFPKKENP